MQNASACNFSYKNEILSRIEEILLWTKNENNTWRANLFSTAAATTALLKLGHGENDLNIGWIESNLKDFEKTKRHLEDVTLFCGFCLGLLSLNYAKRMTEKQVREKAEKLIAELSELNWMNTPKTVAFLVLTLRDCGLNELSIEVKTKIEQYLLTTLQNGQLDLENLGYSLFALSILNPEMTRKYITDHLDITKKIANHQRIEIRALALSVLDNTDMPCVETTYQGVWNYFDARPYGVVERSIIQKLTSCIYNKFSGGLWATKGVRIFEDNNLARIEIDVAKYDLESMVKNTPPIDQLSIVALSILFSNYKQLYIFSQKKNDEYQKLTLLDNKNTHIPIEKVKLTSISNELNSYKRGKILLKYGMLTVVALVAFPLVLSYITGYLALLPKPWSEVGSAVVGLILGVTATLTWIYGHAKQELSILKNRIEKLRSNGEW